MLLREGQLCREAERHVWRQDVLPGRTLGNNERHPAPARSRAVAEPLHAALTATAVATAIPGSAATAVQPTITAIAAAAAEAAKRAFTGAAGA